MKRILTLFLCFVSIVPIIMADENEDLLWHYYQKVITAKQSGNKRTELLELMNYLRIYRNIHIDVSQDTNYATLIIDYGLLCLETNNLSASNEALYEAFNIYKTVFGEDYSLNAALLSIVANNYSTLGDYLRAIEIGSKAVEINKKIVGENHLDYAKALNNLASYYSHLGDYAKAIEIATRALEIKKKLVGENHPEYATTLDNIAGYIANQGNYPRAIELCTQALKIRSSTLGQEHPDYAITLSNLANYYFYQGKYSKAFELGEKALKINKQIYGENHLSYATSLNNIAGYYAQMGDYNKAIELSTKVLDIRKGILGENHPSCATPLNNIATYYSALGNYSKAIQYGTQALSIRKKVLGESHPDYAKSLSNIAHYYSCLGDYEKSIQLETQVLNIRQKSLGTDHPDYATTLSNLAYDYACFNDYEKAIELASKALNIYEKAIGLENSEYAGTLNNLASYYSALGDHIKAIELTTKALEIRKTVLGENHIDYANSLNNLAYYYFYIGDYVKTSDYGNQALDIQRRILGEQHPDYATSLNNLAGLYSALGNHKRAIELENQVLKIRKKAFGENHPLYALTLDNLAGEYIHQGNYKKAIELLNKALKIQKGLLGEEHSEYALTLNNLAQCYSNLGDNNKAVELGTKAKQVSKITCGQEHPDYAKSLSNLADYYYEQGDFLETVSLFNEYMTIIRKNVLRTFSGLTANERFLYWDNYSYAFNSWIPRSLVHSGISDAASILYDNTALFAKGLLLSTEMEMAKLIHESGDTEAIQLYSELRKNQQLLNNQYLKPFLERTLNCDSLELISANLERQLTSRVKAFGDYTRNLSITWRDVQNKLGDNDIAIEFLSYREKNKETAYVALTLCKTDTEPILTSLFTESQLKEAEGSDYSYQNFSTDSLVWEPISNRLKDKSNVYFSATGMLHSIGIEYLPSMEGKDCHRLSSTRELVTHQPAQPIGSATTATIFGGIKYDATYDSIESSAPTYVKDYIAMNAVPSRHRGQFDYKSKLRYDFGPLTGSYEEIKEIKAMLDSVGAACNPLSGSQASEESFKALSGQRKSLIHISTHGCYHSDEEVENLNGHLQSMLIGNGRPIHYEDLSLLRCWLCFAGAKLAICDTLPDKSKPSAGQDDGILNALEIAQMDLRGLDLVVLSACQTALGDVVDGEGVFGLQRGFKKAGAQSILMSLWEVYDEVTHLFMTEFYRGWTSGMTKTAALRNAQSIVKEKYPDPHDWAAFILLDALD